MVYYGDEIIRFDWAMKRLLRQKANFAVLDSFAYIVYSRARGTRRAQMTNSTEWTCSLRTPRET